ncbi:ABC transporter substrate-binding protein [Dongia sp.]|uniref:ABC transporter substrate-binding protein n=1 Tax=Dongia sp. TaxID=1977262 RepID=UPI003750BA50
MQHGAVLRKLMHACAAASLVVTSTAVVGIGAAAAKDITVGVLVPLTGELGRFGEIVASGFDLALDEINAAGGTKCGNLRFVVDDTRGQPDHALRAASKMIDTDKAVAIIGPSSSEMVALVDLAKRKKVVLASSIAGSITLNKLGGDFVYRTVSSDLGDGIAAGLWLSERGYKRVAFLVQNEESTISTAQAARARVEAAGIAITDYVVFNSNQPSYQAELVSVLANQPDAIYLAGGQVSGVTVIKEASVGGFEGQWLLSADLAVPETFGAVGADLLNGRAFVEFADADNSFPEFKAFREKYLAKTKNEPGPFASNSYDLVNLVALALEASGDCTGNGINAAIRNVSEGGEPVTTFAEGKAALAQGKDIDLVGASGSLTFDKSGTVSGAYTIQGAKDGAWVTEKFYPASTFEQK